VRRLIAITIMLCVTINASWAAYGQSNDILQPVVADPNSLDEVSLTTSSFSQGADPAVDLGQFNSFDRTEPGAGIGSNFFGLNDDFDSGLLVRTENVAMKFGGFVKVDFIQDLNPIGSTDSFDVATIEVGAAPRTNTRFHARQTRLNWDTRWNSERGPVRVFVEGDFFFNQRESFELGEDRFRLRQAYGQHGKWIIGQTWSTLSDVAASPPTLDFEGQVASIATRRTQIRWTDDIGESDWSLALALEDPFTLIEVPEGVEGQARTQTPDAVVQLRLSRPMTQFQVAGVVRQLGFQPINESVIEGNTWGINFTQVSQISEQGKFYYEILWGHGIGSFKGLPDAAPTTTGDVELLGSLGWMVGGTRDWNQRLSSNVTFAQNRLINVEDLRPDELDNVTYFAANLIVTPTKNTNFGIEYLYGLRENFDGRSAQANRIQMAFAYFLP
jgi:hypothetical protein